MAATELTRPQSGQAAVEYVGLVAVVAFALAAVAVLVPRPAHQMLSVVERAICTGLGRSCEIGGEESLAFAPCPVTRSVESTDVHATVMSLRAGRGESALVEELSDGTATVTLADRGELGVEGGVGAGLFGGGARVEGSAGLDFAAGRGYRFDGIDEALRFVAGQRPMAGVEGAARLVAGPGCVVCGLAGITPEERPEPDFTYLEGGGIAQAGADAGDGPALAAAEVGGAVVLGRRIDHRTGEVTVYYRLGGAAGAAAAGPIAWAGNAGVDGVVEYTTARDGTPTDLTVRATRQRTSSAGLAARAADGGAPGHRGLARDSAGEGHVVEQLASLDLGDPRNRVAATRLIEAVGPPADPVALSRGLRSVDRRLEAAGAVEVREFSAGVREQELSGDAALGLKLGVGAARATVERTLTAARTRPAGASVFLDRMDCLG
jgi:hypothetical protein